MVLQMLPFLLICILRGFKLVETFYFYKHHYRSFKSLLVFADDLIKLENINLKNYKDIRCYLKNDMSLA